MKIFWVLSIAILAMMNIQCSNKNSNKPKKYFVKGDPATFVANTRMSMKNLKVDNIKSLDGYYLIDKTGFLEAEEYSTESHINEQKGTAEGDDSFEALDQSSQFFVTEEVSNAGAKYYKYKSSGGGEILLKEERGSLRATELNDGSGGQYKLNQKIQHFSITPDKSSFNLMIYNETPGEKFLIVLYFAKEFTHKKEKTAGNFDYLGGKNLKIRWPKNKKVNLDICTSDLVSHKNVFQDSLKKWTENIDSGSFNIRVVNNPPPFSDLNTQCIYAVDSYMMMDSEEYATAAGVVPFLKNEIVDADIFLFKNEIKKSGESFDEFMHAERMMKTITHEIGHFLGMGHPENLFHPMHETIMSYSEANTYNRLYSHDIEAIKALYK